MKKITNIKNNKNSSLEMSKLDTVAGGGAVVLGGDISNKLIKYNKILHKSEFEDRNLQPTRNITLDIKIQEHENK